MTRAETIKNTLRSMHRIKLLEKEMEAQCKNLEAWLHQDRGRSRRRAELWKLEDAEAQAATLAE